MHSKFVFKRVGMFSCLKIYWPSLADGAEQHSVHYRGLNVHIHFSNLASDTIENNLNQLYHLRQKLKHSFIEHGKH